MEQEQACTGSGDPYKEKAALFIQVRLPCPWPGQGKETGFAADEKHDRKLQPFGSVKSQERDALGPGIPGVHFATQGSLGKKGFEIVPGAERQRPQQLGGGEEGGAVGRVLVQIRNGFFEKR